MSQEQDNELIVEVEPKKPKKKKTTKAKSTSPVVEENSITDVEEVAPKKTKSKPKKKKKAAPKQKKTVTEEKIKVEVISESKIAQPESTLQPTGQAEVSEIKVQILPKDQEVIGKSQTSTIVDEPAIITLKSASVQTEATVVSSNVQTAPVVITPPPFAAIKVRNVVAEVRDLTTEIIPNKVIIQGIIHEQLFFVGTDNLVHHMSDDIHFSTFVDIPGVQPGMNTQVTAVIEDIITELADNGLVIIKKFVIEVFVKVTETIQTNILPGNGPILLLDEVIGENTAQTLIESDFTLPFPAIKVDEIVGTIRDLEIEVIKDKVIIQGILHKQIFFVGTDNLEHHQGEDLHFSLFVDIPGAIPGMDVQVHPRIEGIFFHLVSPTVLRQKAVLEFFVKITEEVRLPVTIGNGPLFKVEEFVGENTVQHLDDSTITLPFAAIKVREIVAQIQNLTTHVIRDKVIVQGIIHKQIFFISTDNIERHLAENIPFSLFLDIPGVEPGDNVHLTPVIEAVFFELLSATELRQKVIIQITAVVTRTIQLNLVLGTGLPLFKLEQVIGENTKQVLVVQREEVIAPVPPVSPITVTEVTIVFPGVQVIGQQQIILQNTFELPVTAIKIKEIQAIVTDLTARVIPGAVVVEGTLEKTIFFVDTSNIVRTITERIPFSILVNVPGISPTQVVNATVEIENISFTLTQGGNAVNQLVVLKATVQGEGASTGQVTVVTNVTGPGVVVSTVRVRANVLTPAGVILQEFDVVTNASGPGIAGVTKQTLLLDVVGDGNPNPVPVSVVTSVQLE